MSSESATFEGFLVEARESSDFFGEGSTMHQEDFDNGSTIWGTWVTDPNQVGSGYSPDDFLYHAVECNRSLDSNEGPFEVGVLQLIQSHTKQISKAYIGSISLSVCHGLHTYISMQLYNMYTCIHNTNTCTPTQNAATQNSPADLRSVDLYWRAPPPPNSSEEYQQLPQQIQFWLVMHALRL